MVFRNNTGGELVYIDVHPSPSGEKCNRSPEERHYLLNSDGFMNYVQMDLVDFRNLSM